MSRYFNFYNQQRMHQSLAYQTPQMVYNQTNEWKKNNKFKLKIAIINSFLYYLAVIKLKFTIMQHFHLFVDEFGSFRLNREQAGSFLRLY